MPSKVIETAKEDNLRQAVEIWKNIKELDEDAATDKAILESELSMQTWIDCNSKARYEKYRGKYQRLNDAVKDKINELAREAGASHPILARHHKRIGKMTLSIGHKNIDWRIKTAGTHMKTSVAINDGLGLNRNIPAEIVHEFATKLIDGGYDARYAAKLAVETVKEIQTNTELAKQLGKTGKKKLLKGLCSEVLKELNTRPALVQKDQQMADLGRKDALADNNKQVKKREGQEDDAL